MLDRVSLLFVGSIILTLEKVNAFEFTVGVEVSDKSVWVEDKNRSGNEIAKVSNGIKLRPSFTLRTIPSYFSDSGNWGYHYQIDSSIFKINKQELPGVEDEQNVGTTMKGFSIYAIPVAYYHFNRNQPKKWNYKSGIGIGVGYLKVTGNFQITHDSHPEIGEVKAVNADGFGLAVGIYLEASFGKHVIVIQNYAPFIVDKQYDYQQNNVIIAYRYTFNFFEEEFQLN